VFGILSLDAMRREEAHKQVYFETYLANQAVPWSDDLPIKPQLVIDGSTWRPPTLFEVEPGPIDASNVGLRHRAWGYRHVVLTRGQTLDIYNSRVRGEVCFTTDVVVPAVYEGDPREGVWMSITPQEILSLRGGVRRARGTVVIGGLGMGWMLQKVCQRPSVERVIVVERSRDLLAWFGRRICAAQPKVTDVIVGDVYDHIGRFGPAARYLLDIWPTYSSAAWDDRLERARRDHPETIIWAWGEVHDPKR